MELMKYPKGKELELQRELKMEKKDNRDLREEVKLLKELLANANQLNQEITRINQKLEATATSITDTILPQT